MVMGTMTGNPHTALDFMVQPTKPGNAVCGRSSAAAGLR